MSLKYEQQTLFNQAGFFYALKVRLELPWSCMTDQ